MKKHILVFCSLFFLLPIAEAAEVDFETYFSRCAQGFRSGDYESVVVAAEEAISLVPRDSLQLESDFCSKLTTAYFRLGRLDRALMYGERSLHLDEQIGDELNLSCSLNNLAAIALSMEQYDDAEQYLTRAIGIERQFASDGTMRLAIRLGMLGEVLNRQGRPQEALDTTLLAYHLDSIAGREMKMGPRISQLGAIYMVLEDYPKALDCFHQANPLLEKFNNYASLAINYHFMAVTYEYMGEVTQAYEAAKAGEKIAEMHGLRKTQADCYDVLSRVSPSLQNRYEYLQKAYALNDSIYEQSIADKIAKFSADYDAAEREIKLLQQEKKIAHQRWTVWTLVILLVVMSLFVLALYLFRNNLLHLRNRRGIEKAVVELATEIKQEERPTVPSDIHFSERELEIIRYCCQGLSSKQIADKVNLSPRTVEGYKNSLFKKLNINTTTELVIYAIQHNIN